MVLGDIIAIILVLLILGKMHYIDVKRIEDDEVKASLGLSFIIFAYQFGLVEGLLFCGGLIAFRFALLRLQEISIRNEQAFYTAIENNDEDALKRMINKGCDIDTSKAVDLAVKKGHQGILRILFEYYKPSESKVDFVFREAIRSRKSKDIIEFLIQKGADVNDGMWPAIENKNKDIVELLIKKGADVNKGLWNAIINKNKDIVELLIQKGAKVNDGMMTTAIKNKNKDIVELLIQKGAKVNDGMMMEAIEYWNKDIVKLLIQNGGNIEKKNADGATLLMLAAGEGNEDLVTLLIKKGANINATDKRGWTPLMHAAYNQQKSIVELLLQKGADIEVRNNDGNTILIELIKSDQDDMARFLIQKGADANVKDVLGSSITNLIEDRNSQKIQQSNNQIQQSNNQIQQILEKHEKTTKLILENMITFDPS